MYPKSQKCSVRFAAWLCGCLLAIVLLPGVTPGAADPAVSKEYQIKAAFLLNFAQFVQWPGNTFTNASEPFRIGVLGEDPFGGALEETMQGETVQNRKIIIHRARNFDD